MQLVNVFDVLLEENLLIMKRILEEPQLGVKSSANEKAVRFYSSCMNTEQIDAEGAQPLKELVNEVGGWNITGPWKETDFNQTLQILMEKYNTFPFFKAYVGPIFSDPSTNIIQIDHPEFELPLEANFRKPVTYPEVLRSYYLYLLKLGKLMGGHPDVTSTYISLAFSFISNLQKAVTPLKTRQEKKMLFYRTTIRELQEKAPAIDWLSCLRAAFYPVQLNISQPIVAHDMDYLKGMSQLIEQWQQKRDVLQIYMILCLVRNLSPALSRQFQEARQVLADILERGTRDSEMVRTERWRKCLSETGTFFGPVLGRMVVQKIFPQKAKDLAEKIFSEIRDTIHNHLDHVEWMSHQSHQEAKDKLHSLQVEIGYPENILQTDEVEDEFLEVSLHVTVMPDASTEAALHEEESNAQRENQTSEQEDLYLRPCGQVTLPQPGLGLEIQEDKFFYNVLACLKSLRKRILLRLINPHLQDEYFLLLSLSLKKKNCFRWEVAPWSVHSYYSLRRHAVVFPAGMFRNPFFNIAFPSAVNFGAMGFFMAHELLHSFYEYVLPKNCSVCDVRTLPQGISCLVKQFESYSLKGYSINSTFTLLENAADTGGLAIAYQAYKNWHAKHRGVKELPWPGLSHRQLFFISFAHAMCGRQSLEGLQAFVHRDPHSPPPLRVLGSLRNSQDFARNFHCSSKSSMNPVLKCRIW
ncbi:hypothetical protein EYD10_12207 [Varanus komodoensis]|nr:hypothetical protein EYD10_12207 [Varanus komodoensis]